MASLLARNLKRNHKPRKKRVVINIGTKSLVRPPIREAIVAMSIRANIKKNSIAKATITEAKGAFL